jgi:alginate O-acetyltransferase complex protein AlgI
MKSAVMIGFILSGLIHDVVISIPAQGGYGLPTLYFSLQGIGVAIEKSRIGRRVGLGSGKRGKCFGMLLLLLPVQWLFHRDFVVRIFFPFLQSLGATP